MVELQVIDTGPGITPENRRAIFEEFRRLDQPSPWGEKGLGLGLSICERIAAILDSTLTLESDARARQHFRHSCAARRARAPRRASASSPNTGSARPKTHRRARASCASTTMPPRSTDCANCWRAGDSTCWPSRPGSRAGDRDSAADRHRARGLSPAGPARGARVVRAAGAPRARQDSARGRAADRRRHGEAGACRPTNWVFRCCANPCARGVARVDCGAGRPASRARISLRLRRRRRELMQRQALRDQHRLRAIFGAHLFEDGRHVRLHRGFRDLQSAVRCACSTGPNTTWTTRGTAAASGWQRGARRGFVGMHCAARPAAGTRSGGVQTSPCRMVCSASMMVGTAADLAMKADAPCVQRALRDVLVFAAGDHDHGHRRVVRANLHEAGKAVRARHAEVEQQQIDFRMRIAASRAGSRRCRLRRCARRREPG